MLSQAAKYYEVRGQPSKAGTRPQASLPPASCLLGSKNGLVGVSCDSHSERQLMPRGLEATGLEATEDEPSWRRGTRANLWSSHVDVPLLGKALVHFPAMTSSSIHVSELAPEAAIAIGHLHGCREACPAGQPGQRHPKDPPPGSPAAPRREPGLPRPSCSTRRRATRSVR